MDQCPRCGQQALGPHISWRGRPRLCDVDDCGWVTCQVCHLTIDPNTLRAFDLEGTVTL